QRLQEENRIWVLSRLVLKIERTPQWGETLTMQTWPWATKSVFALRDFEIFDPRGTLSVAGASAWLVLDQGTRKPQRVDKLVSTIKEFSDKRALDMPLEKLGGCEFVSATTDLATRYSDIDANGHVNNSR